MKRERATIEAELAALRTVDFDEGDPAADGMERLYRLCDELYTACAPSEAAPLLFALTERLEDAHLGDPGPVVHTLEKTAGYEPYCESRCSESPHH